MASEADSLDPTILVIFGITGDLSQRYLLPALYHLIKDGILGKQTVILGVTRGNMTTEELFSKIELRIKDVDREADVKTLDIMRAQTSMFQMDLEDPASYKALLKKLNDTEDAQGVCMNRLYYLSIPPAAYSTVVQSLGEQGLNASCQHGKAATRILVEKPFGYDLDSAKQLIKATSTAFKEEQIFRIDHYMAKETVQNILTFRFRNPIFEALWSNKYISSIEIMQKEAINVAGRGAFYDPLGAMRDLIQNHLLQILGIVIMDQPDKLDSDQIHAKKQAALEQVEAMPEGQVKEHAVRGQYRGYREDVNNPASSTETFASITVYSQNPRWNNVPFTLTHGKALDERKAEVCVTFRGRDGHNNQLRFRIQPNEGIELDLLTKKPGYSYDVQTTAMDFSYTNDFDGRGRPDAYERVLVDAVHGSHTLFATSEEILASWQIVQPVLNVWAQNADDLAVYEPGSTGPVLPA